MADWRTLSVALAASTHGFTGPMQAATRSAAEFASVADQAAEPSRWDRMTQAGHRALTGLGVAFVAASAAAAKLGVSVLETGVAYNQLEQSARMAFSTLLGSSDAANALMDDLADFASTSPFPRQAFIEGTQQMLAFGYEAEKVIPTLAAIQDSVAAAGGSSQQLEEVIFVMAQIQAAGKITGQDLMQFGQRGINAAELIGSQMGKTGAQIREDITAGALGAEQALDALALGMAERYSGAADGLKSTFDGAIDAVKAQWRDLGSMLAEPFVSKTGGGAAIDWAGALADAMGSLRESVAPIVVAGLERVAAHIDRMVVVINRWVTSLDGITETAVVDWLSEFGPLVVTAAGALTGFGLSAGRNLPLVGGALGALGPGVGILAGLVTTSEDARDALLGVLQSAGPLAAELGERLLPIFQDLVDVAQTFLVPAIEGGGVALENLLGIALPLASALAEITGVVAGLVAPLAQIPGLATAITAALTAVAGVKVFNALTSGAETLALKAMYARDGVSNLASSIAKISPATLAAGGAITALAITYTVWQSRQATAQQRAQEWEAQMRSVAEAAMDADSSFEKAFKSQVMQDWALENKELIEDLGISLGDLYDALDSPESLSAFTENLKLDHDIERVRDFNIVVGDIALKMREARAFTDDYANTQKALGVATDNTADSADNLADRYDVLRKSLSQTKFDLAEQAGAVRDLFDAQRNLTSSERAVADALTEVSDARRAATGDSEDYRRAQQGVVDAERALTDAQRESLRAQEDLTQARFRAELQLRDLGFAAEGAELSEEAARQALDDARRDLREADPADRNRADLRVRQAELSLRQSQARRVDAERELADAQAKGIEGSDQVVAAKDRIQSAAERERAAHEQLGEAHQRVSQQQVDAFKRVAEASERLTERQLDLVDANATLTEHTDGTRAATEGMVEQFSAVAATLDPSSSLRRNLDEYILRLIHLQNLQDLQPTFLDHVATLFGGGGFNWANPFGRLPGFADGGIASYATGGIHKAVGPNGMLRFAEPSTRQEALVPELGIDRGRARSILEVAAGWHGLSVVDKDKRIPSFAMGGVATHSTMRLYAPTAPAPGHVPSQGSQPDPKAFARALAEVLGRQQPPRGKVVQGDVHIHGATDDHDLARRLRHMIS